MEGTIGAGASGRERILDRAEELFSRRGYSGVGLAEIASAARLGKSSLFHHFRSKDQLYAAVVVRILERIELVQREALAGGGSPGERLERWIEALVAILGARPTFARILLRSLFEDEELEGHLAEEREANALLRRILGTTAALLREGMERGELRAGSVPHTLQSLIGLTIYHFASGRFGSELLGRSLFHPAEVRARREAVRQLLHEGLIRRSPAGNDAGRRRQEGEP